jgi:hypothetical protein
MASMDRVGRIRREDTVSLGFNRRCVAMKDTKSRVSRFWAGERFDNCSAGLVSSKAVRCEAMGKFLLRVNPINEGTLYKLCEGA